MRAYKIKWMTQEGRLWEHQDSLKFLPTSDQWLYNFDQPYPPLPPPSYFLDSWTRGSPPQISRSTVVSDELLHPLQRLLQVRRSCPIPLTLQLLCCTINRKQDAVCLSWWTDVTVSGDFNWGRQIQILKLHQDELCVWAQDFFVVAPTFSTRVRQQEKHQDITKEISG